MSNSVTKFFASFFLIIAFALAAIFPAGADIATNPAAAGCGLPNRGETRNVRRDHHHHRRQPNR